jgi:hypothetical protein
MPPAPTTPRITLEYQVPTRGKDPLSCVTPS